MFEQLNKVAVNVVQHFTDSEKKQGRNNIGAVGTVKLGTAPLAPEPDSSVTIPAVDIIAGQNVTLTPVTGGVEISSADTTYTAGNGISIDVNNAISVDTSTVQEKLTAGTNIQISAQNVISATDTTYGVFSTSADGLVPKASGTGDTGKFLKGDGTWATPPTPATSVSATAPIYGTGTQADPLNLKVSHGLSLVQPVGDDTYLQVTNPVPAPGSTSAGKVLTCDDALGNLSWQTPPSGPTVNDGVLTIQKNGTQIGSFSANQSAGSTVNVEVPVLSTFESTDDEDIIAYLNGLCINKDSGQLLDGINGNVLALLPRPTGSADYGKYLYRNGNTIGYRDLPETAADLKILTETAVTVNSGVDAYELAIEDGRCYTLTMNANREVFLTTNSDKTIHTRIAVRNYGTSVCGGVTLSWYDEGLAMHSATIDLSQQDNTIVYNFDVYIRKVTSGILVYPIARVYDFPCSYRTGGYSGLDSTDNNLIGLDH